MKFREIDTGVKSASWNMASDDVLLKLQHRRDMPTLRFLSFERCALVGFFQSVEQELRVDYCRENGIDINRRVTGGGSLYFDPSQVGWEVIAPLSMFDGNPQKFYEVFGSAVALGLQNLGIDAQFKPRNDIEVGDKKISGMGGITHGEYFLFQGTLLVEDRIEEMLYSLRVPVEKLKPKEIDSVRERVTCIEYEIGRVPSRNELKNAMRDGFYKSLGIETIESEPLEEEIAEIENSVPKFKSWDWIDRIKLPKESQGIISGSYRSEYFGTIKANMTINAKQKMLRQTIITGDFFLESIGAIYDLERVLKNIRLDEEKILSYVRKYGKKYKDLPTDDFLNTFLEVFKKWAWIKEGFSPAEANSLFAVNFTPSEGIKPEYFLFPYCAKGAKCDYRYEEDCPMCGGCTVGDGFRMAEDAGLECLTVTSFEDLEDKFIYIKRRGGKAYIGSCCEPFYIKHQESFRDCGLKGLLVNVKDSTCYDLGKAHEAYLGTFENQTNLELGLIEKVLEYINRTR
ncbi:MAG TPA: DUF116 domain-containing protein [Caldisericia bacterium]|nr:DUF116 domain-containing protein [Caldisericia bacterium]HPF48739.1 DUF116 domain-containing protein [Caldisericia bacterium]HPI83601.1 DUF116 domain-containing protein [Caldisericia bacterium]HPQ93194.1 DUF116 domain-containing protein [Caldisericia bacterium]HRV74973.1 DUF116 domain-containing protein [Caldisericia bacterium]